jgi:uncharacterized phage-associated protein
MNAWDLARYISNLIEVDSLKMQKLLFYTQVVCLVKYNRPAFPDKIEAWEYGPVVPSVYKKLKVHEMPIKIKGTPESEDAEALYSADLVIDFYGKFSGVELINLTHSGKPWQEAYNKGRNHEITNKAIKDYYKKIISFKQSNEK